MAKNIGKIFKIANTFIDDVCNFTPSSYHLFKVEKYKQKEKKNSV